MEAFREYLVGIKGPLTTPIGGGMRSLNVALRQMLDLYVCVRPVRWFQGVPSPVKHPEKVDMVIFRENTEDIYAGIELESGIRGRQKVLDVSASRSFPKSYREDPLPGNDRRSASSPFRAEGTERLVRAAIEYALANKRKSVTLVHKGNIMKFTEGAFRNWGYALAEREFADQTYTWDQWERIQGREGRGCGERRAEARARAAGKLLVKDVDRRHHAPAGPDPPRRVRRHRHAEPERRLPLRRARRPGRRHRHRPRRQHQLRRPATRSSRPPTAPRPSTPNLDKVNPGSVILSGEMMLRYLGWTEAADLDHQGHGRRDRRQDRHLRLRAA